MDDGANFFFQMTTYFDVESAPRPDDQLARVKPEFKVNRTLKDPEKIKADLIAKEQAWLEGAALDGKYGQVLCIGLLDDEGSRFITGPEPEILRGFWAVFDDGPKLVGFNVKGWDLPFLCQRSWALGIQTPTDLMDGRYWNRRIVDVLERWCCYSNRFDGQSLDAICKATGIGAKTGNGRDFAHLFATDRKAALDYLGTDLELTAALAKRLGIN